VSSSIYFSEHHKVLEQIAKQGTILLAVNPEDVSQIYGYIAASRIDGILVIHYVYVKHPYRRFGIAKTLLNQFEHDPGAAACYTHHTKVIERVAPRYNMIYHPYILINHMQEGEDEVAEEAVSES
jgi:GNAT superfamily N-acetyltransferase